MMVCNVLLISLTYVLQSVFVLNLKYNVLCEVDIKSFKYIPFICSERFGKSIVPYFLSINPFFQPVHYRHTSFHYSSADVSGFNVSSNHNITAMRNIQD